MRCLGVLAGVGEEMLSHRLLKGHARVGAALATADLRLLEGSFFVQTGLYHIVINSHFFFLLELFFALHGCIATWVCIVHDARPNVLSALARGMHDFLIYLITQRLPCRLSIMTDFLPCRYESDVAIAL